MPVGCLQEEGGDLTVLLDRGMINRQNWLERETMIGYRGDETDGSKGQFVKKTLL